MSTQWTMRILLLTVLLPFCTLAKNHYQIHINSFSCQLTRNNTLIIGKLICRLHNGGTSNSILESSLLLAKQINQFTIHMKFDLIRKNNGLITLLDMDMNGCNYLTDMHRKFQIIGKYRDQILSKSNLPHKCPMLAHKLYELRNLTIKSDDFPPGAPKCEWILTMKFLTKNVTEFKVVLNGAAV